MCTVCAQAKVWHDAGRPLTVAVNVSARQFQHNDLRAMITASFAETRLEPQYLKLEFTESNVMDNIDTAITRLGELHALGSSCAR